MGILNRLRKRIDTLAASSLPFLADDEDRLRFSAELPAGALGSILKLDVQIDTEAHGDGERVRLRAHVQTNFASVLRPLLELPKAATGREALGHTLAAGSASGLAPVERLGKLATRGARRVYANPVVRRLSAPLMQHDVNNWIEIAASSASLDGGAHDLIPNNEKLAAMGIRPARKQGPHLETWSGQVGPGMAQVSTFQVDKDSLPPGLRKQIGDQAFHLAGMVISTIEEK